MIWLWSCCGLVLYLQCINFSWCEFFHIAVIVGYFVIVLFWIVSHEPADIPPAIVELFPNCGPIGIDGLGPRPLGGALVCCSVPSGVFRGRGIRSGCLCWS